MDVVVDASVVIAVIANEPQKHKLVVLTTGAVLIAPSSVHWEIGKRDRSDRGERMNIYTYTEARQKLATLLDKALQEGEVLIKRRDGQVFVVKPQTPRGSPLDVEGLDLNIKSAEIVAFIQEGRHTPGI